MRAAGERRSSPRFLERARTEAGREIRRPLPRQAGCGQGEGPGPIRSAGRPGARRDAGLISRAVDAHLRYLERDGVTRDGETGQGLFRFENEADGKAFVERGREDRHQFRFIVSPEEQPRWLRPSRASPAI